MNKEEEVKKEGEVKPKTRQIVIETDGNNVNLVSAEVSGKIELVGVLQALIGFLNKSN